MNTISKSELKNIEFFAKLSEEELNKINKILKFKEYQVDDIIVDGNEKLQAITFYIIYKGEVDIIKNYEGPEEIVVATKNAGAFIGETLLFNTNSSINTLKAIEKTSMIEISLSELESLLHANPSMMYKIMKDLSTRQIEGDQKTINELIKKNKLLSDAYIETVRAIIDALEMKDKYLKGHTNRVTIIAIAVGVEMDCSLNDLYILEVGSLLHDIGKIGIPDAILNKPGPLNNQEFDLIKLHPEKAKNMIENISALEMVIPSILYHHERYDGGGYPSKIYGDKIPLAGRIIAVADAFDAMTSNRPYRKALKFDKAIEEITKGSNKQFDPEVVNAFVTLYKKNRIKELLKDKIA